MKSQVAQRKVMIKNEVKTLKTEMIKGWCRGSSRPSLITVGSWIDKTIVENKQTDVTFKKVNVVYA